MPSADRRAAPAGRLRSPPTSPTSGSPRLPAPRGLHGLGLAPTRARRRRRGGPSVALPGPRFPRPPPHRRAARPDCRPSTGSSSAGPPQASAYRKASAASGPSAARLASWTAEGYEAEVVTTTLAALIEHHSRCTPPAPARACAELTPGRPWRRRHRGREQHLLPRPPYRIRRRGAPGRRSGGRLRRTGPRYRLGPGGEEAPRRRGREGHHHRAGDGGHAQAVDEGLLGGPDQATPRSRRAGRPEGR